jgi:hypothetical protein
MKRENINGGASLPEPPQGAERPAVESVDADNQQDTNRVRAKEITGRIDEIGVNDAPGGPYGASAADSDASS